MKEWIEGRFENSIPQARKYVEEQLQFFSKSETKYDQISLALKILEALASVVHLTENYRPSMIYIFAVLTLDNLKEFGPTSGKKKFFLFLILCIISNLMSFFLKLFHKLVISSHE